MRLIEPVEAAELKNGPIPHHAALVMDGNGRWANYRGLQRTDGHFAAKQPVFECVEVALDLGIQWLSIYAFSQENWSRPQAELDVLLNYAQWAFTDDVVSELTKKGVQFRFIGALRDPRIPPGALKWFARLEDDSRANDRLQLSVAFNYSGQDEIVEACRRAMLSGLEPNGLTIEELAKHMFRPNMPAVDLLIRTSGEQRLSNFFLWHMAYAELVFFDTLWPDFRRGHFESAIAEFQVRFRRYGGLPWIS